MAYFQYSSTGDPSLAPDDRSWSEYVLDHLKSSETYRPGHPDTLTGPVWPGSENALGTGERLYQVIADIAPYLDDQDPNLSAEDQQRLKDFKQSAFYSAQARDQFSPFGDQFFGALGVLGAAVGGAAAYGAFAPAAAGAAGAAGAGGTAAGAGGAAASTLPGWASTVAQIAPYASWGGQGLQTVGSLTDNKWLSNLGQALGYAGLVGGGVAGAAGGGGLGGAVSGALGGGSGGGGMGTFDWTSLIGPAIGAAGNIAGGAIASGAARNAANTQTQAAQEANRVLQEMYGQTRADLTPYRLAGYGALGNMIAQAQSPFGYGQYTPTQALDPSTYAFDASAFNFDPSLYQFTAPNQALNPADYRFTADPNFTMPTGQEALNQDPGYQFRMQEGMKALNASAAARGGLQSGAALKAAEQYGQKLASQEYGNAYARSRDVNDLNYQRLLGLNQMDWQRAQYGNEQQYSRALAEKERQTELAKYGNQWNYNVGRDANQLRYARDYQMNTDVAQRNRDQYALNYQSALGQRQQNIGELQALANLGTGAQAQQNTAAANLSNALAGNITGSGAAQAAGQVGSANAWQGALSGIGGAVNQYGYLNLLRDMMRARSQPQYGGDENLR